jgi:hypothetical protein
MKARHRSGISRRRALAGGLAYAGTGLLPRIVPAADVSLDADVIIIGAGAAGLAAARIFKNAGKPAILIEASNRIGGRAITESNHFGVPCDYGAHWLHYRGRNPFRHYGMHSRGRFHIYDSPDEYMIFDPGRAAPDNRYSRNDVVNFKDEMGVIAGFLCPLSAQDKSPHELLAIGDFSRSRWLASVALVIGNWDMAKDWTDFSNTDYQRSPNTEQVFNLDCLCKEGFGALLADSGRDVPVRLGTKVTRVAPARGGRVSVSTNRGNLTARSCIITVSTDVIAGGDIEIAGLTRDLEQAFSDVSMGTYNRVILQFSEDVFRTGAHPEPDHFAFSRIEDVNGGRPRGIMFTTNVAGTNLVYGDVGGRIAEELEAAGPEALRDYAMAEIAKMLGNSALRKYTGKWHATEWGKIRCSEGRSPRRNPARRISAGYSQKPG